MATEKQKEAAAKIGKAGRRKAPGARQGRPAQRRGMSTAEKDKLADQEFAFPDELRSR